VEPSLLLREISLALVDDVGWLADGGHACRSDL
jgi:hypothetical protein